MCQRLETIIFLGSCNFRARLQNTNFDSSFHASSSAFNAGWWFGNSIVEGGLGDRFLACALPVSWLAFARVAAIRMSRKTRKIIIRDSGGFSTQTYFLYPRVPTRLKLDGIQPPMTTWKINNKPPISSTHVDVSKFENAPCSTFEKFTRRRDVNRCECIPF